MVFHGKTISTKQIQTATAPAGSRSLSTRLSLKPEQLKYFSLNNRGEERKILEMQLSLVKHIMPNCVSMVTVIHRGGAEEREVSLGRSTQDAAGTDQWDCPYFNSDCCCWLTNSAACVCV